MQECQAHFNVLILISDGPHSALLNLNYLGGCARREISPWLSQEMRTWTHSHQTLCVQVRILDRQGCCVEA